MRTHALHVRGRVADCEDRLLVRGSVGEDVVSLDLDGEWDGLVLSVVFRGCGHTVAPARNVDGTYTVPWEVMARPCSVRVGVEGRTEEGTLLATAMLDPPMRVVDSLAPADSLQDADPTITEMQQARLEALEAAEAARASRITEASAETLPPGSDATAGLEQLGDHAALRLGIPRGERGDCDFAAFEVGDDMVLSAHYTDDDAEIGFALDEKSGVMEVVIG